MQRLIVVFLLFTIFLVTACGNSQHAPSATNTPIISTVPVAKIAAALSSPLQQDIETPGTIPSFTPLPGPCAAPLADESNEFINRSITADDNGKTFVTHITSRFWIYLDDRVYPLRDLLNAIPEGLIGYISDDSIRGPQCYPIMYEAVKEGKGQIRLKDFQLSIVVDDTAPTSSLPLP